MAKKKKGAPFDMEYLESKSMPEPNSGCLIWLGTAPSGYGSVTICGNVKKLAHRMSLELFLGRKLKNGMYACHKCDVRACINPHHLFEGSAKDNTQDCIQKGRSNKKGPHPLMSSKRKLTESKVIAILEDSSTNLSDIARRYGVSQPNIRCIRNGLTWKYLTESHFEREFVSKKAELMRGGE